MRRSSPFVLAAACFTLALGLPFGRATVECTSAPTVLLSPRLTQDVGHMFLGQGGTTWVLPGQLRMELIPFVVPRSTCSTEAPLPGRSRPARVPLVGLLVAALLASRGLHARLSRATAIGSAVLLLPAGLLPALPSSGAFVAILGLAILGMGFRRATAS